MGSAPSFPRPVRPLPCFRASVHVATHLYAHAHVHGALIEVENATEPLLRAHCLSMPCAPIICCGVCAALTDDKKASKVAPAGGMCLILGWATMALLKR